MTTKKSNLNITKSHDEQISKWRNLYEATRKFEELAPWQWIDDSMVFGVKDPETGEVAYCSIMGNLGEFHGLGIYRGSTGLHSLDMIMRGDVMSMHDKLHTQKCLLLSFGKRDYVPDEQMKIIKELDLWFERRNFWPSFMDHTPGYYPWGICDEDVSVMTMVIEQVMQAVEESLDDVIRSRRYISERFLVRVAESEHGKLTWHDEFLAPDPYIERYDVPVLRESDEVMAYELKKTKDKDASMIFELDMFYMSKPVREDDERPYFPIVLLAVDRFTGMAISVGMVRHDHPEIAEIHRVFLESIEKSDARPSVLRMRNQKLAEYLRPIADIMEIKVEISDDIDMLDEAKDSFLNMR